MSESLRQYIAARGLGLEKLREEVFRLLEDHNLNLYDE
jgi:hypothetical protein